QVRHGDCNEVAYRLRRVVAEQKAFIRYSHGAPRMAMTRLLASVSRGCRGYPMTEWNASDYSRQSSLQQAMAEEQLSLLTLAGTERVLDVGCGDGKITAEIAARVPHGWVLGVDPSQSMIAFGSSHFGPPVRANLRFEVADVRGLPYCEEFDLV